MPWGGYNYEDSILINEHILAKDIFTSIHIESFEIGGSVIMKLGKEEITRDMPTSAKRHCETLMMRALFVLVPL